MGQDPTLIHDLLTWLHTSVVGGHSSRNATWQRVRSVLYWIGDCVWNDLLSHWNAPEYRSKFVHARKKIGHSKKGGYMHTGGSISLQDHNICLVCTLKL